MRKSTISLKTETKQIADKYSLQSRSGRNEKVINSIEGSHHPE